MPPFLSLVRLLPLLWLAGEVPTPQLSLHDGDRVIFLGNGFVEQERQHGHLETRLTARQPEAKILFRNLGWGGDTVRGIARTSGYQAPDGIARLFKEVQDWKPTVVLLAYGLNESFAGPQGLSGFVEDHERLLSRLSSLKARIVLISPTYHEDLGRPLPDPAEHNRYLEQYTAALQKLAARQQLPFVDLFHALQAAKKTTPAPRFTTNGIHLNESGYALVAGAVEEQLHLPKPGWRLELDPGGKVHASSGFQVEGTTSAGGVLRFRALATALPVPAVGPVPGDALLLRMTGLPPGQHLLRVDGAVVQRASAAEWSRGVQLTSGPTFKDLEDLRTLIVHKSQLFYRRWRPFNDHSRHWGFMKGDYQLYDQEIARAEEAIAQARRPRWHSYEISAQEGAK